MTKRGMGASTPATLLLKRLGVPFVAHAYEHDPEVTDFGAEAAAELDVAEARVFKTLLVQVDGVLRVGVVPVSGSLDLKAMAAAVGGKRAAMADAALAERKTGYVLGGISPIAQRNRLQTVLDESAKEFSSVFVSGGRRGFDLEVAAHDLVRVTGAIMARIARAAKTA